MRSSFLQPTPILTRVPTPSPCGTMAREEAFDLDPTSTPRAPATPGSQPGDEGLAWHERLEGELVAGRYHAVRLLGAGGMGVVYAGVEERTGAEVALKLLHPRMAWRERTVKRFAREAQILAALSHPNIVRLIEYVADWQVPVLVMERVAGQPLDAVIRASGPLGLEAAADLALQVLAALEAAHGAHVVHRDLKPSNVLLGQAPGRAGPVVKVLDFGLALMLEGAHDTRMTAAGALIGTPSFMAPEQVLGGEIDERTDLYALGVVLFNALTGRHLHFARSFGELIRIYSTQPEPTARDLAGLGPEPIAAFMARALAAAPRDRFQSARQMTEALEAALVASRPAPAAAAEAPPPTLAVPGPRPRPAPRRGRLAIAVALAALAPIALVLALAGWAATSRSAPPRTVAARGRLHRPAAPIPDPVPVRGAPPGAIEYVNRLDQTMAYYLTDSGRRVGQARVDTRLARIVGHGVELDGTLAAAGTRWVFEYLDRASGATRVHAYATRSAFSLFSFELRPAAGGAALPPPPLLDGCGVVPDSDAVMQIFARTPGCASTAPAADQPLSLIYRGHESDPARAVIEVEPTAFRLVTGPGPTCAVERDCEARP